MSKYPDMRTVYSGADSTLYVNNKAVGEAQGLQWVERFTKDGPVINGVITLVVFDQDCHLLKVARKSKKPTMRMEFLNEYGQHSVIRFKNPQFISSETRCDIDMIYPTISIEFQADEAKMRRLPPETIVLPFEYTTMNPAQEEEKNDN